MMINESGKVVLAFDSFKGSFTAPEACQAAAAGLRRVPGVGEIGECPLSDGGEGYVRNSAETGHTAVIDSIKLAYWQMSTAEVLPYIMPVYLFEGDITADGKNISRFSACIEAVKPEFLEAAKPSKYD